MLFYTLDRTVVFTNKCSVFCLHIVLRTPPPLHEAFLGVDAIRLDQIYYAGLCLMKFAFFENEEFNKKKIDH